ncbi:hypothetical protein, partial [Wukongibacter baidiensis]
NGDVDKVEETLNDDYDKYTKGDEDLKFKYDVKNSSSYVKVEMEGTNFKRTDSDWEKRDDDDFQDFIEKIAKEVQDEIDKKVKIDVEDKDNKETAEYEYDDDKLDVKSEYGEDDDGDVDKVEETLNDDYDKYTEGKDELRFKYDVKESSSYVKVDMEGTNFKRTDSDWEKRDDDDFQDFIEKIAKEVQDEIDKKVKIDVDDKDNKEAAEYEYDDNELDVKSEYGEDDDETDKIEETLNDDYDKYTKGDEDLKFKYEVKEISSYVRVNMEGTNFKRTDSEWEKRDDDDFQDFIEKIAEEVVDEIDKKVKIYVEDESNKDTAEYEYDDGDLDVKSEYGENNSENAIEEKLNDEYNKYTKGEDDLKFTYKAEEKNSYVNVDMKGTNFKRDSTAWEERDTSEFRDFVEKLAKEIAADAKKDVKIALEDEENKDTAEYEYDEGKKDFEVKEEYKKDHNGDSIEDKLNDDYETYEDGKEDLKFEYEVIEYAKYAEIKMEGTNFTIGSSEWEKRDEGDFQDFVKEIAKEVGEDLDKNLLINVTDEDDDKAGEYEYYVSGSRFEVIEENGGDGNIEDKLNDDYEEYEDGKEDLEFEYNIKEYKSEIKVEMDGKNFTKDSDEWEDRGKSDFRDFVEKIAEYVSDKTDKDVVVYVDDEDGDNVGKYEYDESKEKFKTISEYDK